MKQSKRLLAPLVFLAALLTGCADYVPVAGDLVGMAEHSVVYVRDASIAKELTVHQTLRNRDDQYATAYKLSGTEIHLEMREVMPGIHVQVISQISSREAPVFAGALPTEPSRHPLWDTVDNAVDRGTDLAKFWLGFAFLETAWTRSAPQYQGPVGSYNPITTTTTNGVMP